MRIPLLPLASGHVLVYPVSRPRRYTLTGAPNAMYLCLPNHAVALAKGVGGGPHFQVDQGLLLEILEKRWRRPRARYHSLTVFRTKP